MENVELPLNVEYPSNDNNLASRARIGEQLSKLDLHDPFTINSKAPKSHSILKGAYCLDVRYKSSDSIYNFDDMNLTDEWQLEVYLYALGVLLKHNLKSVVDIGCGSGYKLVTYLRNFNTIGYEVEKNIDLLKKRYPDKDWRISTFSDPIDTDVIICADVIEHLVEPDILLAYLIDQKFKFLILSTPDRNLVYPPQSIYRKGPPKNKAHVREWNSEEFLQYVSSFFNIIDHKITNLRQSTQTIICNKKKLLIRRINTIICV